VLIERGSEVGGDDVRTDLGTVAHIVRAEELPDGRWALVTIGARRIRVVQWLPDDPYPVAEVEDWPDPDPGAGYGERAAAVAARLRQVLALAAEAGDRTVPATIDLSEDPVLALLQASAVGPFGPLDQQRLLAAPTPEQRADLLDELLVDALAVLQMRLSE
jgi:Lon protease-like protein